MSPQLEIVAMPKALCLSGMVVSGLVMVMFGLDLALGIPFRHAPLYLSVGLISCAAVLGYLSWTAYREQT